MSFSNKVVIVTGAGSGIGAAAAIAFSKEGANVVIVDINEPNLQKVQKECVQTGSESISIKADVSSENDAKRIIEETIKKFGKIDVLVNNAGIARITTIFCDNILEVYDSIMKINLRAPVYITHLAASHLVKTKGNIVNISSAAGKMAWKINPSVCYAISKAGVQHFTRSVAVEFARYGVRVNSISPGPVRTDLLTNAGAETPVDVNDVTALGRVSDAEEVADLILFLASDKAKAITGSDYVIDNGYLIN